MNKRVLLGIWIVFAITALILLAYTLAFLEESNPIRGETLGSQPAPRDIDTSDLVGGPRPAFALTDHHGTAHHAADWDGQVLVVNFWATWCVPCRREIPAFVELQQAYGDHGLQFVGIALDSRDEVRRFVDELDLAVNFPLLIAGDDQAGIALATDYGNRFGILPYTVFVDRAGQIDLVQFGEISHAQAERAIRGLL